jgi:mannosyltransferase
LELTLGITNVADPDLTFFQRRKKMAQLGARWRTKGWWLFFLILLLASALRLFRIDHQSFWNDEGNSARLAERSVALILEGARGDIHPPGYYLFLHYWSAVWGDGEAALRGLSAVCSVMLVAVTYFLSRQLFRGEATALLTAGLVAVNPFQIYYAQEARMYAMLALWAALSTWALARWRSESAEGGDRRRWTLPVYVLSATAGLYTHYAFPFVMLAQNAAVALWLWHGRRHGGVLRLLAVWVIGQTGVVVLFLPWLPTALHQVTSWSPPGESYPLDQAALDIWRVLNLGPTVPSGLVAGGLIAATFLVLLSLIPPVETEQAQSSYPAYSWRWALCTLTVLIPVGLILLLGLYRESYQKFLLVSAAPLSVLVARGIWGGWRIASGVAVWGDQTAVAGYRALILFVAALFLFDTGRSLNNLYFDPDYARADYRAIAAFIRQTGEPEDAVILNAPNQWEVFTYYFPHTERVYPVARQRPFDVGRNQAELEQILAHHQRIFVVYWGDAESDPARFVESWLEAHTYKASETWYGDVRLAVYAVPTELSNAPETKSEIRFALAEAGQDVDIYLDGFTLSNAVVTPGDILQLSLFWHAPHSIGGRYKVFVHLYDQAGELVTQTDSEPGGALRPTNTWSPGEQVVDRYGILIPAETPPGTYTLSVGWYALGDPSRRFAVFDRDEGDGDRLQLAKVRVTKIPAAGNDG